MKSLIITPTLLFALLASCQEPEAADQSFSFGADTTIIDGTTLTLSNRHDDATYLWSTGETTPSITVDSAGTYWLLMTVDGDQYSDTINVDIAWRTVKLESSLGDMQLWLHLKTPLHREAFLNLIEEGYFDNHTFNRVINHFVIQGGCPDLPGGFTDTSLFVEPEFHDDLKHVFGAVGGGRDDNPGKKTNACQFYIVDDPKGPYNLSKLDGDYTIFGQIIKGLSVVDLISRVNTDKDDAPIEEVIFALSIETYTAQEIQKLFGYNISD